MIDTIAQKTYRSLRIDKETDTLGGTMKSGETELANALPGIRSKILREELESVNSRQDVKARFAIDLSDDPSAEPYDILEDEDTEQRFLIVLVNNVGDMDLLWQVFVTDDFSGIQPTNPPG